MKVVVTGAYGFIGKNLIARLEAMKDTVVVPVGRTTDTVALRQALDSAEVIYHLAGVNRPENEEDFEKVNVGFTVTICDLLRELKRKPIIVMASSIQAELDNPYGRSKRKAEEVLRKFEKETGANVRIVRLKNIFGKWCRPNYNSVVATFCNLIANKQTITISDPSKKLQLSYIDDVVDSFITSAGEISYTVISLGELAEIIKSFRYDDLKVPDFSDLFVKQLYSTYLSYVPASEWKQQLLVRSDARGSLAEFVKSNSFGQIFVSRTKPGYTRGNHYHHTKIEKFLVLEGEGVIRLRRIGSDDVLENHVKGEDFQVINIPPGYTHSIENIGSGDLVTLFWANDVFDVNKPDTVFLEVKKTPRVSIVLTTFNRPAQLHNTLISIFNQAYKDFEVIVVDDGDDTETSGVCKKFDVRYLRVGRPQSQKYRNPAVALNMGIRKATGDIVILQNAECKHIDPDTISKLSGLVSDSNAVFARVASLGQDGKPVVAYPIYCGKENPRPLFFCGAIKRSWFEKLRGFDEDYVEVCYEDDDFADRLKKEGVKWVFTDVEVHHQFHPYLGYFNAEPSKKLYMKKSSEMAAGTISTVRNLGRDWGVLHTSAVIPVVTSPPIVKEDVVVIPHTSMKYGRDGCTVDWWSTHRKV